MQDGGACFQSRSVVEDLVSLVVLHGYGFEFLHLAVPRERRRHLRPQFCHLLAVHFHLNRQFFEIFLELVGRPEQVLVPIQVQLAHIHRILHPKRLDLCSFLGQHDPERFRFVMEDVFGQVFLLLLGQVPPVRVEHRVYLVLPPLEIYPLLCEFLLEGVLAVEYLEVAVEVIADVLEEGVQVFLDDLVHPAEDVAPLDCHVVHGDEDLVELAQAVGLRDAV